MVTKAAELYEVAPGFFNYIVPFILVAIFFVTWKTSRWFMDGKIENLEGQKQNFAGEISVLEQRLDLAKDQSEDMKRQITELKEKVSVAERESPRQVDVQDITRRFEQLLTANIAQSSTLNLSGKRVGPEFIIVDEDKFESGNTNRLIKIKP
jgi:predicted nuclease with TOPRIM domain